MFAIEYGIGELPYPVAQDHQAGLLAQHQVQLYVAVSEHEVIYILVTLHILFGKAYQEFLLFAHIRLLLAIGTFQAAMLRPYQYLYEDATGCIFMNQETFEQVPIAKENVTGGQYMKEGDVVEVVTDTTDGTILLAEMPAKTTLKITHSEPGVKGNTATNATKPATLETGAEVRVPLFVNEGETIQVDTRDGSYLGRVSE